MPLVDLSDAGLDDWQDPATAACADHGSTQRLLAAVVCTMIAVANARADAERPGERREYEEQFRECDAICRALGSLLKSPGG